MTDQTIAQPRYKTAKEIERIVQIAKSAFAYMSLLPWRQRRAEKAINALRDEALQLADENERLKAEVMALRHRGPKVKQPKELSIADEIVGDILEGYGDD